MLVKILGSFMLVGGIVLAIPLVLAIIAGAFAFLWTGLKIACVAGLIYLGWRWLNDRDYRPSAPWKASRF